MSFAAYGPVSFSSVRPDHYMLESVPKELEGLCKETESGGAGKYRCPAWAYELYNEQLRRGYSLVKGDVTKRNEILERLQAAREDPDTAEAEDSAWRLTSEKEQQPRAYGVTGLFPIGSYAAVPSGP